MYAFVEVFAGGASVGLSLLQAGIIQRLVLNDTDPGVYAFWKALKEEPKELLTRLAGKTQRWTISDTRRKCWTIRKDAASMSWRGASLFATGWDIPA